MDLQATQPTSDDQELAKVLAGISKEADVASSQPATDQPSLADSTTPAPAPDFSMPPLEPAPSPAFSDPVPEAAAPSAASDPSPVVASSMESGDLDAIKKEALGELRPLVDKLNVAPEEKFDTYLLLLRSTDDRALIGPAHEAARGIADEARRAQALLDIIKEIDYLSGNAQSA